MAQVRMPGGLDPLPEDELDPAPNMDFEGMGAAVEPGLDPTGADPMGMGAPTPPPPSPSATPPPLEEPDPVTGPLGRAKSVEEDPNAAEGTVRPTPGPFPAPEDDAEYESFVPREYTLPPPTLRPGEIGQTEASVPQPSAFGGVGDDDILSSIMAGVSKPF